MAVPAGGTSKPVHPAQLFTQLTEDEQNKLSPPVVSQWFASTAVHVLVAALFAAAPSLYKPLQVEQAATQLSSSQVSVDVPGQ